MKTIYGDNFTRFSDAITAVANAIRTSPENRKRYNRIILDVADSLIEYEDARRDSHARNG
ncbi:MAG TPA: hypothetical protein VGD30_03080 [Telluria sp.]